MWWVLFILTSKFRGLRIVILRGSAHPLYNEVLKIIVQTCIPNMTSMSKNSGFINKLVIKTLVLIIILVPHKGMVMNRALIGSSGEVVQALGSINIK